MPFKVQSHLPSIGLELYQLGVHILAKKTQITKSVDCVLGTQTRGGRMVGRDDSTEL